MRKKINGLRTQYANEKNEVKKSMVSGAGTEEIYKPTLWCYSLLSFLDESNPVRESQSSLIIENLESQNSDSNFEIIFDGDIQNLNETPAQEAVLVNLDSPLASPTTPSRDSLLVNLVK